MPRLFRLETLTPPELTPQELDLFCQAQAEGIVQAFEEYPATFSSARVAKSFASAACRETDERRRVIFIEGYTGGYLGVAVNIQQDPIGTADQARTAKAKTREENLRYFKLFVAAQLAQS